MSKESRKQSRIYKLCKNKTYTVNKRLSIEEYLEIKSWCKTNLNGCFYLEISSLHEGHYTVGFQDHTDMMAFILRWV